MKKTIMIISVIIACILLVMFLPIPKGSYDDGGTREYNALTYKIVVWNKLYTELNEDGGINDIETYHKTSVYWYPDNQKSIDELWKIEQNNR